MTRLVFDAILAPVATQYRKGSGCADADCLAAYEQIGPIAASAPRLDFLYPAAFGVSSDVLLQTEWKTNNVQRR